MTTINTTSKSITNDVAKEALKQSMLADFQAMQTAQQKHSDLQLAHHTDIAPTSTAGLVGQAMNPLAGSAAEVFARAGVISITEPTKATITFENEHAAFKNTLVMYKLDANGVMKEAQAIFPNASAKGSGGQLVDGRSSVDITLNAGDQIGFALLPNGFANEKSRELLTRQDGHLAFQNWRGEPANLFRDNPESLQLVHIDKWGRREPISGEFGNKVFHSTGNESQGIRTNFDGKDHADQLVDAERGKILMGFDDLPRGEDAIRKNVIVSMDIGRKNAAALTQDLIDDRPKTFREMAGADWKASHDEIMTTARMYDEDGDGRLNEQEWAKFAPLLNLTQDDHKHFVGLRGRGDLDSLSYLISKGDVSGDGRIDERELLELGRRLNGNNPQVVQSFREAAGVDWKLDYEEFISTAEAHDKNGDGLSQAEWNRFAPILGLTPPDRNLFLSFDGQFDIAKFKTVFELADTNGDGHLEPREVLDLRRIVLENFAPTEFPDDDRMTIQPYPMPIQPPVQDQPGEGRGKSRGRGRGRGLAEGRGNGGFASQNFKSEGEAIAAKAVAAGPVGININIKSQSESETKSPEIKDGSSRW